MTIQELVKKYNEAALNADHALLNSLFAPGAVVWHNFDAKEIPFELSVERFAEFHSRISERRVEVAQVLETPRGCVLQSSISGRITATGEEFETHNCLVFTLDEGAVVRLDEYIDPGIYAIYGGRAPA